MHRAIVYAKHGDPSKVLRVLSLPALSSPQSRTVNLRLLLAPINPADVNVIEGVYPSKPTANDLGLFIGGNEGVAEITQVGPDCPGLNKNDRVIFTKQQLGTWASVRNVKFDDILKLPAGLTDVHAATITVSMSKPIFIFQPCQVNPPTAYNMLTDFVTLNPGEWILQNGANSAVGQAVIQIAAARGLKTMNFVRNRDDLDSLKNYLTSLGATHVFTYDDLQDKAFRKTVSDLTNAANIRLALNCVGKRPRDLSDQQSHSLSGGPETSQMVRLLGDGAHLVSYGAMSKQPLSLPTSLFIFKDLTSHGFWQSRWYTQKTRQERENLLVKLSELIQSGKVSFFL